MHTRRDQPACPLRRIPSQVLGITVALLGWQTESVHARMIDIDDTERWDRCVGAACQVRRRLVGEA